MASEGVPPEDTLMTSARRPLEGEDEEEEDEEEEEEDDEDGDIPTSRLEGRSQGAGQRTEQK